MKYQNLNGKLVIVKDNPVKEVAKKIGIPRFAKTSLGLIVFYKGIAYLNDNGMIKSKFLLYEALETIHIGEYFEHPIEVVGRSLPL